MLLEWILSNKETLKLVYALVIFSICAVVVLKTDRLFKLSDYQGLRYFRNSFFFYGLAFFSRFILGGISEISQKSIYFFNTKFLFEFFIVVAGFFLLYSLVWKIFEKSKLHNSLFNLIAGSFYFIGFFIGFSDFFLESSILMYLSQIILFLFLAGISYSNFSKQEGNLNFLRNYFIITLFGLISWILNLFLEYFPYGNPFVQIWIYGLNILFFVFFLYAITKITENKNG